MPNSSRSFCVVPRSKFSLCILIRADARLLAPGLRFSIRNFEDDGAAAAAAAANGDIDNEASCSFSFLFSF